MTWFKIDDSWYRSRKVRKLGRDRISSQARVATAGLWALSGDWSADNLTDGFVPWEVIEDWDPDRKLARRLIDAGLWYEDDRDDESGCQFHDWADWQPTRDQVVQRRKADAERRARWREARRSNDVPPDSDPSGSRSPSQEESRRDTPRESQLESPEGSVLPDPTRPDPTRISTSRGHLEQEPDSSVGARKRSPRATRIPDDFAVDSSMVAWAREHTPDVDGRFETERFRDYWCAKSGRDATKLDWIATWRNWMRRAQEQTPHAGRASPHLRLASGAERVPTTTARVAAIEALRHPPGADT